MDFFRVCERESRKKGGPVEVYADYIVRRSDILMVQGSHFYAMYNKDTGLWSRDEYEVARLVDNEIRERVEKLKAEGVECVGTYLTSFENGRWKLFRQFLKNVSDNSHPLDTKLTFASTKVKKTDYASRRLPYDLAPGDISAYDELVSILYTPEERAKFEWALGAVIEGEAKKIQKFLVFHGGHGTGKSTILDIIAEMCGGNVSDGGYVAMFDAQALTGSNSAFSMEAFRDNPLVAIQHDGDLSKIEDNSKLNSIVSSEKMRINEKFKPTYDSVIAAMLFMGTNKDVKITDAKSGLIRRLIDVYPTGNTLKPNAYRALLKRIKFEHGAIAQHCLDVYRAMGRNAYSDYIPTRMMAKTDVFYNFVEAHFDLFKHQDSTTLKQAWSLYKEYAKESELKFTLPMYTFREQLKNYFDDWETRIIVDGVHMRNYYWGFSAKPFREAVREPESADEPVVYSLVMEETESILDDMYAGLTAQYANANGNPKLYWDDSERIDKNGKVFTPKPSEIVSTVLGELDTSKLHYVKVPEHHVVIDFDLTDTEGNKSPERNLEAASSWPPTYGEFSKSGGGIHLHYIYDGDVSQLSRAYSEGIEVKVFTGNAGLRRKLSKCNNVPVATISTGSLPVRKKPPVLTENTVRNETTLRALIKKNLRKGVHPGTKPSIDFIEHLLKEAHREGYPYDVSDLKSPIMAFANNSQHQQLACLKAVTRMQFKSAATAEETPGAIDVIPADERLVFFDCEVFKNLFLVCWKYAGENSSVVTMMNPTPGQIEELIRYKLVGFNNRPYDNHILWGRMQGMNNMELYELSQKIIVLKDENAKFGEAWNISYADAYDILSDKMSLKKWEILLGIPHMELDHPWDEPIPKEKIPKAIDYCINDVLALEAVWNHNEQDFVARKMLSKMSGLPVNSSTRQHVLRILFGNEANPQKQFVYTDLSEQFPGYTFDPYHKTEKSVYKGKVVGEGGYVYAEPGMYENVALLDIASMHPTSIVQLHAFGPYTAKFSALMEARLALKNNEVDRAMEVLPGIFDSLPTEEEAKALAKALKLALNSTYGYTAAKFENRARDKRNVDNIVAKRGALFMIDLVEFVQDLGYTVVHVKTDSIKIANANKHIIELVKQFGEKYGYTFEHEATYKKMCLVNDAVYVAKVGAFGELEDVPEGNSSNFDEYWTATGAEFKHPYIFKTLFTHEPISFRDLCETKQVKEGVMYLRYPEGDFPVAKAGDLIIEEGGGHFEGDFPVEPDVHIGRSGLFVPVNPYSDLIRGGELLRIKDEKSYAVSGTKGYVWAEAEMVRALQEGAIDRLIFERMEDSEEGTGSLRDVIDMSYYNKLIDNAVATIQKFGDVKEFVS